MEKFSMKPMEFKKGIKSMVILGLGLVVTAGIGPFQAAAGTQDRKSPGCAYTTDARQGRSAGTFDDHRLLMARGGNRYGGGQGMGQGGYDNTDRGHRYGPGDGTGTGDRPQDGTGYGAKKGAGTGDCDGTGPRGKGRGRGRSLD